MKKIIAFLTKLFNKTKYWIQRVVEPSVKTVEAIKKIIDNPVLDIITALTPFGFDDILLYKIRERLPKVLIILGHAKDCSGLENPLDVIKCAIDRIKDLHPEGKKAAYHSIAALLSNHLSDGKLSFSDSVHLSEMVYKKTV